jgi:cytochrome c oxidase subunit 4
MKIFRSLPVRVLASLYLLLGLSSASAFLPLGHWNWLITLAIALMMALLVLLFFMKVRSSSPLIRLTSAAGFTWLILLIVLMLLDYLSRPWPR